MNHNESNNLFFFFHLVVFVWLFVWVGGFFVCLFACFGGKTKQHNSLV